MAFLSLNSVCFHWFWTGFYWVFLAFNGFYIVSPTLIGFHSILVGFTWFYWVLLGFTGLVFCFRFFWIESFPRVPRTTSSRLEPKLFQSRKERQPMHMNSWSLEFYRVLLGFLVFFPGFHSVLLGYTGFPRLLYNYKGFYWVLLGFTWFYWVSLFFFPVFIRSYWVLLDFPGYYRIIKAFTEFYWVLLGFTGFPCFFSPFSFGLTGFYWISQVIIEL